MKEAKQLETGVSRKFQYDSSLRLRSMSYFNEMYSLEMAFEGRNLIFHSSEIPLIGHSKRIPTEVVIKYNENYTHFWETKVLWKIIITLSYLSQICFPIRPFKCNATPSLSKQTSKQFISSTQFISSKTVDYLTISFICLSCLSS